LVGRVRNCKKKKNRMHGVGPKMKKGGEMEKKKKNPDANRPRLWKGSKTLNQKKPKPNWKREKKREKKRTRKIFKGTLKRQLNYSKRNEKKKKKEEKKV